MFNGLLHHTNHATPLITAAIIPTNPAISDSVLTTPPRVLDENDNKTPINPNTIAIAARINPNNAPVVKLKIAATSAMIDGILNFAALVSCASMR